MACSATLVQQRKGTGIAAGRGWMEWSGCGVVVHADASFWRTASHQTTAHFRNDAANFQIFSFPTASKYIRLCSPRDGKFDSTSPTATTSSPEQAITGDSAQPPTTSKVASLVIGF